MSRVRWIGGGCLAGMAIVSGIVGWSSFQNAGAPLDSSNAKALSKASPSRPGGDDERPAPPPMPAAPRPAGEEDLKELQQFKSQWVEAKKTLSAQALLDARKSMSREAVLKVGGGEVLTQFFEFLDKEGQGDLKEWVATTATGELFASSEKSPDAKAWLLSLGDAKLRQSICFGAGENYQGDDFKAFLNAFSDIHSQSRLLAGYCSKMAEQDPKAAVKAFMSLKPAKVDFTGLRHVMAVVPAGSDFVGLSQSLPDDSKSLAKAARKSLLQAWARSAPREAADFVLSNRKTVSPDQLGVVLDLWSESDRAASEEWVRGLDPGEHRDAALAAESRRELAKNPARAWSLAGAISNDKMRSDLLKETHKQWSQTDRAAANAAWAARRDELLLRSELPGAKNQE